MRADTSEPAFPAPEAARVRFGAENQDAFMGVTMRDYFAAKALSTICAYGCEDVASWTAEDFAKHAYGIADAMLAERAQ